MVVRDLRVHVCKLFKPRNLHSRYCSILLQQCTLLHSPCSKAGVLVKHSEHHPHTTTGVLAERCYTHTRVQCTIPRSKVQPLKCSGSATALASRCPRAPIVHIPTHYSCNSSVQATWVLLPTVLLEDTRGHSLPPVTFCIGIVQLPTP